MVSIHFWVPSESFFLVNGHIGSSTLSHLSLVKSNDIMCIYIYLYVQYKTDWLQNVQWTVSTPCRVPGGSRSPLLTLEKLDVSRDLTNRCAKDKEK